MHKSDRKALQKFSEGYIFKILGLGVIILLLLIPTSMISGLVRERSHTAKEAEEKIMEAWGSEFTEAGPVMAIPGIRTSVVRTRTEKEGEKVETVQTPFTLYIAPQKLNIQGDFTTEVRHYGIFSVPLFVGKIKINGNFDPRPALLDLADNEKLSFDAAKLVIALGGQKGIRQINRAVWNNRELFFQSGLTDARGLLLNSLNNGIHAALAYAPGQPANFDIELTAQGGQSVRILPIGQDTQVNISADWSSPSFRGAFLPVSSSITDRSFAAQWNVSHLSRNIPLFWKEESQRNSGSSVQNANLLFGVYFYRQIDTYALNTRAVKYAVLFLLVPFLALFLMEIFAKRRIHPVPYLLSGIGNIIFYLLLLSFSEQIPFFAAYCVSALSVATMMILYSRALLGSWQKSWYMGLVMGLSYILLYAVLNAESYALLIGSIGAFAVTALLMYLTRQLDWYGK
ncbi:MAG: cell envelope integrity protein CreD [Candidatus Margulisbacteria bacterium]|jgi:inner membrane protein|nr:cell envelope integrity protein CreD [Candidatus Margulisiibacteriota bacterium]